MHHTPEATEALEIFRETKALLEGHFILRSGLHSGHFFQCATVCQYLDKVTRLAELLLPKLQNYPCTTILSPAMGGLVIGQEVARQLGKRFLFVEKVNDQLHLRRGFRLAPKEPVVVIEDVITRGGRVQECLDIVHSHGATVTAIGVLVDRSEGKTHFSVPHHALLNMSFPTYDPQNLPPALAQIPPSKPGS